MGRPFVHNAAGVGHYVRQKPAAGLEPIDLIEVRVGPNRCKMYDLIEAMFQAGGFRIEKNETHRLTLCLKTACQSISHRRRADAELPGKCFDTRVVLYIEAAHMQCVR